MDHWGDPWADNADDKSPKKDAVTSPLPPAFTFAPVPLNGFVDDAGWGNNDDEDFGDWATSPRIGAKEVTMTGAESPFLGDKAPGSASWDTISHGERGDFDEKWTEAVSSTSKDLKNIDPEPSDSATVTQLDEVVKAHKVEKLNSQSQPDIGLSARSSTSPSEASRNELPIESPRTSTEDERIAGSATKDTVPQDEALGSVAQPDTILADASFEAQAEENTEKALQSTGDMDDHGSDPNDAQTPSPNSPDNSSASDIEEISEPVSRDADRADTNQPQGWLTAFTLDTTLLALMFPQNEVGGEQTAPPDDPIYSTSARKAWYRLTRKQTMREFNHGDNDDNYVRVTWTNSHVRAEVNKVVSRWAREDRISGTGPGAKASFYWDTPAPVESKAPFGHLRTQSSVPATKTVAPARQSLPPLAASKAAAFDWSSSVSADTWKLESPVQWSTPTPLARENLAVAKIRRQGGRAVSVDHTLRRPEQTLHKPTARVSHTDVETTAVANSLSPRISQPPAEVSGHWTNPSSSDTTSVPGTKAGDSFVDDNDWGEMVQTPTLPASDQLDPFPQFSEVNNAPLPQLSKPSQQEPVPAQAEPTEPMFASPIMRLQSTISPTSALFKPNSFVPLHTEQGPIGPGILKPANRAVHSPSEKKLKIDVPTLSTAETVGVGTAVADDDKDDDNDESSCTALPPVSIAPIVEKSISAMMTDRDPTPTAQPATPIQATTDSWTDVDFSCFESALPVIESQPPSQTHDPSDPFSFFNTPASTSTHSTANPYSRSPPRDVKLPPLQPLTNATSSLQRLSPE